MPDHDQAYCIFYFCIPNTPIKKVKVKTNLKIGCILTFFNENKNEYVFIYDGNIVDCNSTFLDIGITENKTLFAIKDKNDHLKNLRCNMKNEPNLSFFERKLKIATNKNLKKHYDHINDIRFLKIIGSYQLYKKKMHKLYINESNNIDVEMNLDTNYEYQLPSGPSTEPMPILW